jgi:RNA polymerase sigma factor (sigma-70 family)
MNDLNPTRGNYSAVGEAIRSAHQGNAGAFETIYQCYRGFVRRVCLGMPRDPIEVEDATQDMFRRVLLKLHTFRGESAFSTWLYRLTTNLVFMHFRKNSPEQISLGELLEDDNGPQCEVGGPDLHLNGLLDRIDLQAAVDLLPEGSKAVFVTMSKVTATGKLPAFLDIRSGIQSPSCIKPVNGYVSCLVEGLAREHCNNQS